MGLDRPRIRGRVGLAAAAGAGIGFQLTGGFPWLEQVAWAAAAAAVSAGATWFLLRRRYAALEAAELAAGGPIAGSDAAELRERLTLAFFKHDPADLLLDDRNPGEYAPEVRRLMEQLPSLTSEARVRSAVHLLLLEKFETAPEPRDPSLQALAAEIWALVASSR